MFYIPFNLIQYFNSKSGQHSGVFRYCTSQRVYLYLTHFNSGRIHKNDLSELVEFFGTSKQNIVKALDKLIEWKFITKENNYYRTNGIDKVNQILEEIGYEKTSTYLYKFTKEDLQNASQFKLLIFKYIGQNIAFKKGLKFASIKVGEQNRLFRIRKRKTDYSSFVVVYDTENGESGSDQSHPSGQKDNLTCKRTIVENPTITALRQKQSLSYLGKTNDRSSRTIGRKLFKAKEANIVKVKSFDGIPLSSIVTEHIFNPKGNYVMLESERRGEGYEMLERIKAKFPILTEDAFVSYNGKEDIYRVVKRPANVITYTNVEETMKLNRRLWVKRNLVKETNLVIFSDSDNSQFSVFNSNNDLPF